MSASKFRSLILESAERIVTQLPGTESGRKPQPALGPKPKYTKKRPAKAAPESEERANKRPRTRADQRRRSVPEQSVTRTSVEVQRPLQPTRSSRLNALAKKNTVVKSSVSKTEQKEAASVLDNRVAKWLPSEDEFETDNRTHQTKANAERLATVGKDTKTLEISVEEQNEAARRNEEVVSSYSFDEDGSLFEELLKNTPGMLAASQPANKAPTTNRPLTTPIKAAPVVATLETLTPPSLSSSLAPSPASTDISTAGSPIKAFIRQLPSSAVPTMPISMPWLKADHRVNTCFRIAEVSRLQSQPRPIDAGTEQGDIVELYARTKSMVSQGAENTVQFADLFFPGRPPYLIGTCKTDEASAVIASFLSASPSPRVPFTQCSQPSEQGDSYRICRAIIRTKPGASQVYVLNIKETDWTEVEHVRGIVKPAYQSAPDKTSKVDGASEVSIVKR